MVKCLISMGVHMQEVACQFSNQCTLYQLIFLIKQVHFQIHAVSCTKKQQLMTLNVLIINFTWELFKSIFLILFIPFNLENTIILKPFGLLSLYYFDVRNISKHYT